MAKKQNLNPKDLESDVLSENDVFENKESMQDDQNGIESNGSQKIDTSIIDEVFVKKDHELEKEYQDQLIEQAEYQKELDRQKRLFDKEFKRISKDINPMYDLVFSLVNTILSSQEIKPLDLNEQNQIKVVIYDFTSSTIKENIEKAENIAKYSQTLAKYFRLGNVLITIVLPRVLSKVKPKE